MLTDERLAEMWEAKVRNAQAGCEMAIKNGWLQNHQEAMVLVVHAELTRLRERVRVLEADLAINARLLARQCDLAREAETQLAAAQAELTRLRERVRVLEEERKAAVDLVGIAVDNPQAWLAAMRAIGKASNVT